VTTSAFLSLWSSSVVPTLIVNFLSVVGTLLGLSMVVGYGLMMVRSAD
jgi:hypothetical protein